MKTEVGLVKLVPVTFFGETVGTGKKKKISFYVLKYCVKHMVLKIIDHYCRG